MDGTRVKPWFYRAAAALLIAASLLACCAVPAKAVVAETVMVGGTLVVATVLVALGFVALSDTRLGDMAQRVVDAAAAAGVPWLTADREIAVLQFGVGVAKRVARQVVDWVKGWVADPVNSALVGTWRADIAVGTVYPLTGSGYIDPDVFVLERVLSDDRYADLWNNYVSNTIQTAEKWNAIKEEARFIVLGVGHSDYHGDPRTNYYILVIGNNVDYSSVKVTNISNSSLSFGAFVTPEGVGTEVYPNQMCVYSQWTDSGAFVGYGPGVFPGHDPSLNRGVVAMNYGGPGVVYDGPDLLSGTVGTVYPAWDALGDADTLPLAVPGSFGSLVGVTAAEAQTVASGIAITGQPQSVSAAVGQAVTFVVTATGRNLTFQWQYSRDGGTTWTDSPATGSDTPVLSVPVTASRDGYMYRCVVTDIAGSVAISDAATLTVTDTPEPEPSPSPSPGPAPLPDEVGGMWQYVRALIAQMADALSHFGAFIRALPPAILVPVWAGVALMVIIGLLRAFLGG